MILQLYLKESAGADHFLHSLNYVLCGFVKCEGFSICLSCSNLSFSLSADTGWKSSFTMSIPPLPLSLVVMLDRLGSFNNSMIFLTPSLIPPVAESNSRKDHSLAQWASEICLASAGLY